MKVYSQDQKNVEDSTTVVSIQQCTGYPRQSKKEERKGIEVRKKKQKAPYHAV
jgi:hypothetical protein